MAGTLAVDLGGTNMRVAVVGPDGVIVERHSEPTPRSDPRPAAFISLLAATLRGAAAKELEVDHAVVGLPGRIDHDAGRLETAPNLPLTWIPALDEADLEGALGVDVFLANDADLAAVGEAWFGAGRGRRDVAYVTISTGIGAGVVLGGRLVRGRRSLGELGHTIVDLSEADAGRPATVEDLGSGTALGRRAAELGLAMTGREVVEEARRGDPRARAVLDRVLHAAAAGVVNLCWLFSPELVVIGGGLGRNGELVLAPIRQLLARSGPDALPVPIEVVEARLGDDAALYGAAAWRRAFA